jgi:glycosyltransferase involved in cell wall biosynthesis
VALLLDLGIDLVHVHHAMRAPLDVVEALLDEADRRSIPVAWTLHDYFTLCPAATLLDADDGTPCTSLDGGARCEGCEALAARFAGLPVEEWRREWARHLSRADRVFSPSQAAAQLVGAHVPAIIDRVAVVAHGVHPVGRVPPHPGGRHVAVLGYGGAHKGDRLLGGVVEALVGRGITWHLFGRRRVPFDERPDVIVHGPYERAALPGLLVEHRIAAVLLLSPWPETYSYTLSEAWRQGIPVIGSNLGAIAERIRSEGGGVVVDPFDPRGVADAVERLLVDGDEMARIAVEARRAGSGLPTPEHVADAYAGHYGELAPAPRPVRATPIPSRPDEDEMSGWLGSFRSPLPG